METTEFNASRLNLVHLRIAIAIAGCRQRLDRSRIGDTTILGGEPLPSEPDGYRRRKRKNCISFSWLVGDNRSYTIIVIVSTAR